MADKVLILVAAGLGVGAGVLALGKAYLDFQSAKLMHQKPRKQRAKRKKPPVRPAGTDGSESQLT